MSVQITYPDCELNVYKGITQTKINSTEVSVTNLDDIGALESKQLYITNGTNTAILASNQLRIYDATNEVTINESVIGYTGNVGQWSLTSEVLNMVNATDIQSQIGNGNIQSQALDGAYVALNTTQGLNIDGNIGSAGQVLQKSNPANAMEWGAPPFCPTATGDLDMNSKHINNIASLNATTNMNINGQTQFDTPPHIPDPILGNDAASKGYVDMLIGNYNGNGLTLYFNYVVAQDDTISAPSVGELHQTLAPINSPTTNNYYKMMSVASETDTLISTFTTDVGYPNTLTIPAGLWSMMIWGYTTNQNGQLYYYFRLNEVDSAGNVVGEPIATSGFSSDVNAVSASDPDAYHCSLAIVNGYTMASVNSRLQIKIYTNASEDVPNSTELFTLFGGDYYSNVTTTLNGATSLLTQNNTWTGVNDFTAGFNTTAVDSATTLSLGTGTATTTTLGRSGNTTNINGATIGLTATTINLTGDVKTTSIDSATTETLAIGGATTNAITLGYDGLTSAGITANTINLTGAVKTTNIDMISGDELKEITMSPDGVIIVNNDPNFSYTNTQRADYIGIKGFNGTTQIGSGFGPDSLTLNTPTDYLEINSDNIYINDVKGEAGQLLQIDNTTGKMVWDNAPFVGSANKALNMNGNAINGTAFTGTSFDNAMSPITLGGTTSSTTLGNQSNPTTINANNLTLYAGGEGTSGQVLKKGETYATWGDNWSGTATSPLDMSSYAITGSTLDSAVEGTLNLGTTNSTLTTLGSEIKPTAINAFNLRVNIAGNIGATGQVLTSTGHAISGVSFQNVPFVGTATSPLDMSSYAITGSTLDTAVSGNLNLGTTNALMTTLGRSAGNTVIQGANIGLTAQTSSNINAPTINLTGAVKTTNIDSATTLSLGTGTATTSTLGRTTGTTAIQGNTIGLTAPTINLTGDVKTTSIDATVGALTLGGTTSTGVNVGRLTQTTDLIGNVKVNGISGNSGQVLTSMGLTTAPTWQAPTFVGTADKPLSMAGNAITEASTIDSSSSLTIGGNVSTTSLVLGKSGVATSMMGNVDIANSLTLGTLPLYGASSGSFGTYVNTGNLVFATNFPNPNTNFTLVLTGTGTITRTLTLPLVRNGYSITILNNSYGIWTITTTSPDMIYGGFAVGGASSFNFGLNKAVTLQQIYSAFYCVSESITASQISGRNSTNNSINICGQPPYVSVTSGSYTIPNFFAYTPITIFRYTGSVATQTFTLLSTSVSGFTFIIRNDTAIPIIVNCSGVSAILINTSATAQSTFTIGVNKTLTLQTIGGGGYCVTSYDNNWIGDAQSNLNMSTYAITNASTIDSSSSLTIGNASTTSLVLGKSGVATSMVGNVDFANRLTLANGTLSLYGASSGSFGTYNGSATSYTFATDFPFPNTNFTLVLTTATTGRTITLPPVRNGYTINIVNISGKTWTIKTTSPDMMYGGFAMVGNSTFNLENTKSVILQQINSGYYILGESITNSAIMGRNENSNQIYLCGIPGYISNSSGAYTITIFWYLPVTIFRMTGTFTSPTFTLLSTTLGDIHGGHTFIIKNDTTGILTINSGVNNCIYTNTSATAQATFKVGINKTVILQTYFNVGYFVVSYDDNWVGTATSNLNMGEYTISSSVVDNSGGTLTIGANNTSLTLGKSDTFTNIKGKVQINGSSGTSGQVLTTNGNLATWQAPASSTFIGTADKTLDMNGNAITGTTSIDSAGTLSLGTTSLGTTLGTTSQTTNIKGNVQINESSGTEGQVLTSRGTTAPTWQSPSFIGTADKALDMNGFNINMNEPTNNDTLLITAQSLTMRTIDIDSTAIISSNQIRFTDGVSGIVNSMTNVNNNMISGDGFKEITMSPESVILSDSSVLPSTTTITPNDISFVVNGDTTATYSKEGIALQNGALPNNLQISQDSILLSNATKNLELTQTQIKVNGSEGTATQVFTKDATNNVIWANPAFVSIATNDLDMAYHRINNLQFINYVATDGPLTIYNQAIFDIPPHIPDPVLVNDAASKGYVDTLIGNTQAGETDVLSSTSGTVTYATSYTTKPKVVLSLNTNITTTFIPIGVYSHTIVSEVYTGFTWASATTSETATISWHSYI